MKNKKILFILLATIVVLGVIIVFFVLDIDSKEKEVREQCCTIAMGNWRNSICQNFGEEGTPSQEEVDKTYGECLNDKGIK